ncbi:Transcription factor GTE12 [Quillaja saponaria]|uniref:Transcription factor GTE12 n=1 Tax=Quillaja saponaria TaxID=32244 RepID=A0AAD7M2L7_QUISA|nr:Transcription factor GTE12 [Quillaja saponaria]
MIATETIIPRTKLKIKFSTKRIEVDPGMQCEHKQKVSDSYERGHSISKENFSIPGANKRGHPGVIESQKQKRQKMDRRGALQCSTILKSLMSHSLSCVFEKPVDPVALQIPDYFSIISKPMDLGTIKSKLAKNMYSGIEEFAADVRLTFSNAMRYNPPGNQVHELAKEINNHFERRWKDVQKKSKCEASNDVHERITGKTTKEITDTRQNCNRAVPLKKDVLPKRSLSSEDRNVQMRFAARDSKGNAARSSQMSCNSNEKLLKGHPSSSGGHEFSCIGGGSGFSSVKENPLLALDVRKCSRCGSNVCHCVIHSDSTHASSDTSSEGTVGRDRYACGADILRLDCQQKGISPLLMGISYPDSDASALDNEQMFPGSQLATPDTDVATIEGWSNPLFDVQLSPRKALRAAMLKSRFADTILKAQQKTLLDHGDKVDPLKMQQEKERLERMQLEEKARIEAQIKAAEAVARMRAEEELKQRRQKERQAARAALQKMKKTAEIDQNLEILKELEKLSGCTLSYRIFGSKDGSRVAMGAQIRSPLERLGLFMKDEYLADDDEEMLNGFGEEGEILS